MYFKILNQVLKNQQSFAKTNLSVSFETKKLLSVNLNPNLPSQNSDNQRSLKVDKIRILRTEYSDDHALWNAF